MVSRRTFLIGSGLLTGQAILATKYSWASGSPTVIASLPATITTSGQYILTQSHSLNLSQGAAIEVQCDDVQIDLGGYTITNSSNSGTFAVGVFAEDRIRVSVTNGTLSGFHTGVFFYGPAIRSAEHLVSTVTVSNFKAAGIVVSGDGSTLKTNTVETSARTTTFVLPSCATGVMGIAINRAKNSVLIDNSITLNDSGTNDFTLGLLVGKFSSGVIIIGTTITNADVGILFDETLSSIGEVRDTVGSGVGRLMVGGVDLGNNS